MRTVPFNSRDCQYKTPFGAVPEDTRIQFTIRPHRQYGVTGAFLLIRKEGETEVQVPFTWISMENGSDIYTGYYDVKEPGLYWYGFLLLTGSSKLYISKEDQGKGEISEVLAAYWQLMVYHKEFTVPKWFAGGIIYQIFPDRFHRQEGILENIPSDRILREDWGELPDYTALDTEINMNQEYYGGNLRGIIERLDYLESLGVTVIYLNPIFEAHSNHRYNTADYRKIDPLLGTEEDFRMLCKEAHSRGIHILLDGVFNHTGDDSIYFNKYGRYPESGAFQSKDSEYCDWFNFTKWPEEYRCWWRIDSLPETNKDSIGFQNYLFQEKGVLAYWLKAGADGWRLDVVDELPSFFVKKIRQTVKKAKPEAMIIGEVWEDASNKISYGERRHYLEGEELDSVMNYPLTEGIVEYIKKKNSSTLNNIIMTILENYPKPVVHVLMNLLGTHDTVRILTRLRGEPPTGKDRSWQASTWLSEAERELGQKEVAIAAAIQYFLPGVPCIYYGDEIGLEGYLDPLNRRCFLWEEKGGWLTDWYQRLGSIRRKFASVLKSGDYVPLTIEQGFYVFLRKGDRYSIICAFNLEKEAKQLELSFPYQKLTTILSLDRVRKGSKLEIRPNSCKFFKVYIDECNVLIPLIS